MFQIRRLKTCLAHQEEALESDWLIPETQTVRGSPERKRRETACIIKDVSLTQYLINNRLSNSPHRHNTTPLI